MGVEAVLGTVLSSVASKAVGGIIGGKPKSSAAPAAQAQAQLDTQSEEIKKRKALQASQRKPTETLLTGGQGLTGVASGGSLG